MNWIKNIYEAIRRKVTMNIEEIFANYFIDYCEREGLKEKLSFTITSLYRKGDEKTNPHAIKGNAMDFTLRLKSDYAPIKYYNDLFVDMMTNWPFRAGIDNTYGNIHIHVDLGNNRPDGQKLPFFFKEEDGKYTHQVKTYNDLMEA
jgi:hypothetical protein